MSHRPTFLSAIVFATVGGWTTGVTWSAQQRVEYLVVVGGELERAMGRIDAGSRPESEVRLRDSSEHAVRVRIGARSCTCVDAALAPEMVGPGEEVTLQFSTVARADRSAQTVGVQLLAVPDAAASPASVATQIVSAAMSFSVNVEFEVQPTRLLLYIPQGSKWSASVFVHPVNLTNLEVTGATTDIPGTQSELRPVHTNGVGEVIVSGTANEGAIGYLVLETNSMAQPKTAVLTTVVVVPRLYAVPHGAVMRASEGPSVFACEVHGELGAAELPSDWTVQVEGDAAICNGMEVNWRASESEGEMLGLIEGRVNLAKGLNDGGIRAVELVLRDSTGIARMRLPLVVRF